MISKEETLREKTLVFLPPEEGTHLRLLPLVDNQAAALPAAYIACGGRVWAPAASYDGMQGEEGDVASLVFFEGLRQQIAAGRGLRCPLQAGARGCCGRRESLLSLWEVGERLRREGIDLEQWDRPTECPRPDPG